MKTAEQVEDEEREAAEKLREEKRQEIVKLLKPGSVVSVIKRFMPGPNGKPYKLTRLATWKQPNAEGIVLAKLWSKRQHDPAFKDAFERAKGPQLLLDDTALVVAVLPSVPDELNPTRPWALLMTYDGRIGWCYALDGLRLA